MVVLDGVSREMRTALATLATRQAASHAARVSKLLPLPWQPPYVKLLHCRAAESQYLTCVVQAVSGAGKIPGVYHQKPPSG